MRSASSIPIELSTTPISLETDPFKPFRVSMDGKDEVTYAAGLQSYRRNFGRDSVMAGILAGRPDLLESQVVLNTLYQGRVHDPYTGEMPGRTHHELDAEIDAEGRSPKFNACDTSGLHLSAIFALSQGDPNAFDRFNERHGRTSSTVDRTVEHILYMVSDDNLYYERAPEGNQFARPHLANVTYWKDSHIPDAKGKLAPVGNVSYALAHFITARGLLSAGELLADQALTDKAHKMFGAGIDAFIKPDGFTILRDDEGNFTQPSSDELHALAYIPTEYLTSLPLTEISKRAQEIETEIGYACTPEEIAVQLMDQYHGHKVWPVDNAFINYGATKFGLNYEAEVAARVAPHIGQGQEQFGFMNLDDGTQIFVPEGNGDQLFSVAAKELLSGRSDLVQNPWL